MKKIKIYILIFVLLVPIVIVFAISSDSIAETNLKHSWVADTIFYNSEKMPISFGFMSFKKDHKCTLPNPNGLGSIDGEWYLKENFWGDKVNLELYCDYKPYEGVFNVDFFNEDGILRMKLVSDCTIFYCSSITSRVNNLLGIAN